MRKPITTIDCRKPGWATFPVTPVRGVSSPFAVANLATQTDIKTTWDDGSTRLAILTAKLPAAGEYVVTGEAAEDEPQPDPPTNAVVFRIGADEYVAHLDIPAADKWLDGPLVVETRHYVTPTKADGAPHPLLRVTYDQRTYSDGAGTVSVRVENCLDVAGATVVTYDVAVWLGGVKRFERLGVKHWYTTNWTETFTLSGEFAEFDVDPEMFHAAKALPRFAPTVANTVYDLSDNQRWDILQRGGLSFNQMDQASARAELGFFPDWVAQYLVHRHQTQKEWTIRTARRAGSFPVHLKEPDGNYLDLNARPTFWFDYRGPDSGALADRPKSAIGAAGVVADYAGGNPFIPDRDHAHDVILPGYLLTGDRFLLDELLAWAHWYCANVPPGWRGGEQGRQIGSSARGTAWPLRVLAGAAAFAPDDEPTKPFLEQAVRYSLEWHDRYAAGEVPFPYYGKPVQNALGTSFEMQDDSGMSAFAGSVKVTCWQQAFLCYAIQRCNDLGFVGGLSLLDRMTKFMCSLLDADPDWPVMQGVGYYPMVGQWSGGHADGFTWTMFATLAEAYEFNRQRGENGTPEEKGQMGWPWSEQARFFYGPIQLPIARLGARRGVAHAAEAAAVLEGWNLPAQDGYALSEPWY